MIKPFIVLSFSAATKHCWNWSFLWRLKFWYFFLPSCMCTPMFIRLKLHVHKCMILLSYCHLGVQALSFDMVFKVPPQLSSYLIRRCVICTPTRATGHTSRHRNRYWDMHNYIDAHAGICMHDSLFFNNRQEISMLQDLFSWKKLHWLSWTFILWWNGTF